MKTYLVGLIKYHSDQFNEEPMKAFLKSRHAATLSESLGQHFWAIQTDEKAGDLAHQWAMTLTQADRGVLLAFQTIDPGETQEGLQKAIGEATAGKEWFPGGLQNI